MKLSKTLVSVVLSILILAAVPAVADVTWNFTAVNVQPGTEPDITGTITTPDPPFGAFIGDFRPPSVWPASGQLVVAAGTLGGPGEIFGINDAEMPLITIVHDGTSWLDLNFNSAAGASYQIGAFSPYIFVVVGPGGTGFWQVQSIVLGDSDGDGVLDADDLCPDTVIPESVPTVRLGVNRFALTDDDGVFNTTSPNGKGPKKSFTIEETAGCSCEQIIAELGLGNGHTKFGCSISAMEEWLAVVGGM